MRSGKCFEDSFSQAVEELVIRNVWRELAFLAVEKEKINIGAVIQLASAQFSEGKNGKLRCGRFVKARRSFLQAVQHSQVREAQRASSRGLSRNGAPQNLALRQNRLPESVARSAFPRNRERSDTFQVGKAIGASRDFASTLSRKCLRLPEDEAEPLRPAGIGRSRGQGAAPLRAIVP